MTRRDPGDAGNLPRNHVETVEKPFAGGHSEISTSLRAATASGLIKNERMRLGFTARGVPATSSDPPSPYRNADSENAAIFGDLTGRFRACA